MVVWHVCRDGAFVSAHEDYDAAYLRIECLRDGGCDVSDFSVKKMVDGEAVWMTKPFDEGFLTAAGPDCPCDICDWMYRNGPLPEPESLPAAQ
jgi:hypothetical protein